MTRRYLSGCLAGIVLLLLSLNVWAQSFNATLTGSVTDPSGLPVPAVELTLTPVGTGVPVRVTSGSDGLFSFPNLQSGEYELRASITGFKEFFQPGCPGSSQAGIGR